jgi:hypothetical protein
VQAIYTGGITIVEISMTIPNCPTVIRVMVREYGNKILGGAGTNVAERSALADLKALRAGKPSEISRQSKSPAAISRRRATTQRKSTNS